MAQQLNCPFCAEYDFHDRSRLFSMGFQGVGICLGSIQEAIGGYKPWRWKTDYECFRCGKKGRCFTSAPHMMDGIGEIGICEACLKAGEKYLLAPPETLDIKQPRKLTKAERDSGNV